MTRKKRLKRLKNRMKKLEISYEEFDMVFKEEYINEVLSRYDPLITFCCFKAQQQLQINFIDQYDIKQEFLEYLLKWTYVESKRRILNGETDVWVPFIKRSFRNFIINFQNYHKKGGKRRPLRSVTSLSAIEGTAVEEQLDMESIDLQGDLEVKDYITKFMGGLTHPVDREVFKVLFFPSKSFKKFNLDNISKYCNFEIIAQYIQSSYTSVLSSYNRIHKNFVGGLNSFQ